MRRASLPRLAFALLLTGAARASTSGLVDIEITPGASRGIEALVAQQRLIDALDLAIEDLQRRLTDRGADDPDTLLALHRVGTVAHLAGEQAAAEEVLAAALAARRRVLDSGDPAIAETLLRRGQAARYRGDRERARRAYEEAAEVLARRPGASPALEAEWLQRQADWVRGEDESRSIPLYERALAARRALYPEPSFAIADNETWLAWTLARTGRRQDALVLARDAARQLDALGLGGHSIRATIDNLLADQQALDGHAEEAEPLYRATALRLAEVRRRQGGAFSRASFPLDGFDALAVAALERGRTEEAWLLAERGLAATHVDFSALGLWGRRDPAGYARWRSQGARLDRASKRLSTVSGSGWAWNAATAVPFLEVLRARAAIARETESYLQAYRADTPNLERVRRALGPKDALVGWLDLRLGGTPTETFLPDRSQGYAYVVRNKGPVVWIRLWQSRSQEEERTRIAAWGSVFRRLMRAASWPTRVDDDPEIFRGMRAWGRVHVDPILPALEGVERLLLERLIEPVDLAVLPDGRLLGDAFEVSFVPSAHTLVLLDEAGRHSPRATGGTVLAVAGPTDDVGAIPIGHLVGAADAPSLHRGSRTAYRREDTPLDRLPRLHYAALEARAVASVFPHAVLLGGNDASDVLERMAESSRLASFRVVHVATHTLTDGDSARCALALSDRASKDAAASTGLVEAEDILLRWRLDADLMTLSGCETVRAGGAGRGEPYGFTPAIFAAGARRILSSKWPVDDRATTILMARFYENYTGRYDDRRAGGVGRPMTAAQALQEAKRYVRFLHDPSGRQPYGHPIYWAGFFLIGVPG
jgi:tetratricopeptide (TPR) repeat protein